MKQSIDTKTKNRIAFFIYPAVTIIIVVFFYTGFNPLYNIFVKKSQNSTVVQTMTINGLVTNLPVATDNYCINMTDGIKEIIVSISDQHLWACNGTTEAYDTAVTTGAYKVAGDETPTGTWKIYAKQTNRYLTGPGYRDFVQYWMPFHGNYGFHDASWQTFPFGGSLYPTEGSHGCVHLPTSAAKWLFNWSSIGTTVMVEK
ncbi:MAG: L,D-transpeptidase [Candidatus Pacebacteria bacterium]|nr:L,D-transpeptidase [Candidatus Paceibacterota bacterium]